MKEGEIFRKLLWDEVELAKDGTLTSDPIYLDRMARNWKFALQTYFTSEGAATVSGKVLTSIDGVNFVDTDSAFATNLAKDTHEISAITPTFCSAIKIQLDEDDVAAITALTAWIAVG